MAQTMQLALSGPLVCLFSITVTLLPTKPFLDLTTATTKYKVRWMTDGGDEKRLVVMNDGQW